MNRELSPLEAFDKALDIICKQKADSNLQSYIDIVETALEDFEELKKGIEWRITEYIKELDSGVDCDGVPLSETNRKIVLNLYNIMGALESYYREKN